MPVEFAVSQKKIDIFHCYAKVIYALDQTVKEDVHTYVSSSIDTTAINLCTLCKQEEVPLFWVQ